MVIRRKITKKSKLPALLRTCRQIRDEASEMFEDALDKTQFELHYDFANINSIPQRDHWCWSRPRFLQYSTGRPNKDVMLKYLYIIWSGADVTADEEGHQKELYGSGYDDDTIENKLFKYFSVASHLVRRLRGMQWDTVLDVLEDLTAGTTSWREEFEGISE